jgi:hypothetical protein
MERQYIVVWILFIKIKQTLVVVVVLRLENSGIGDIVVF